jgi:hypothetical protein
MEALRILVCWCDGSTSMPVPSAVASHGAGTIPFWRGSFSSAASQDS